MRLDPKAQTLELSLLYVGAKGAGKRANLRQLAAVYGPSAGPFLDVSEADSEESGSFLRVDMGAISGFQTQAACATVSPQALERGEGASHLARADALVLVMDSRPERHADNQHTLRALALALESLNTSLGEIPTVYQWNHQDAAGASSPAFMRDSLDPKGQPGTVALARDGVGVWETHIQAVKAALASMWLRASTPSQRRATRSA